jgi:hypothetical protein
MRKLPIGVQSFEKIIEEEFIYIDKTGYIPALLDGGTFYFLSRPRRFGKSLFLSTLKAYFEGKKELFKGLKISEFEEKSKSPWEEYPVLHFSFATGDYRQKDELDKMLNSILRDSYERFGINRNMEDSYGMQLLYLVAGIKEKTGKESVILIDEYDKPLLDNLSVNNDLEEKNRDKLKGFYGSLKDADPYLKMVFITGVTKFSKISLFSDLNQLNDISLREEFSGICGITEDELENAFLPEIDELAKYNDISKVECLDELKKNYDGYHFSAGGVGVYNPFSLLNCFEGKDFEMYWFGTGTPTFLINTIMKSGRPVSELTDGISATKGRMENYRADQADFIPLFYQAGYLTIVGYDKKFKSYKLAFPNNEVKYGFLECLIPLSSPKYEAPDNGFSADRMTGYLENRDLESFMTMIKALLASIPYYEGEVPSNEQQWRNILYAIFTILGQYVRAEVHSSRGRSDCIIETDKYIYIFEFKQDKSADEALSQIEDKGYAVPYISSGKEIIKIGANFSSKEQTIDGWKVK